MLSVKPVKRRNIKRRNSLTVHTAICEEDDSVDAILDGRFVDHVRVLCLSICCQHGFSVHRFLEMAWRLASIESF